MDALSDVLTDSMLLHVLSFFGAEDLQQCGNVCRGWKIFADSRILWENLVQEMWKDKIYIPAFCEELRSANPKAAFVTSVLDARR